MQAAEFIAANLDASAEWDERGLVTNPSFPFRRALLAATLALLGQADEASGHIAYLQRHMPRYLQNLRQGPALFKRPEDNERLLQGLRTAGLG